MIQCCVFHSVLCVALNILLILISYHVKFLTFILILTLQQALPPVMHFPCRLFLVLNVLCTQDVVCDLVLLILCFTAFLGTVFLVYC